MLGKVRSRFAPCHADKLNLDSLHILHVGPILVRSMPSAGTTGLSSLHALQVD